MAGPQEKAVTGSCASKWEREHISPWTLGWLALLAGPGARCCPFLSVKQNGQQLETSVTPCPLKNTGLAATVHHQNMAASLLLRWLLWGPL